MLLSAGILTLVALPPFVPPGWRDVLMQAFAGVCHQLPGRSPHWGGAALAVCDRCLGIYTGVLVGSALTPFMIPLLDKVYSNAGYLLIAILAPVAIDWAGPVLGLWSNAPASRLLTGGVLGIGAGLLLMAALVRTRNPAEQRDPDVALFRK